MVSATKIAALLERVSQGVAAHDRENPDHHTWGIGMAHFDIERLGLDEGEELLPGIVLQADGGMTGQFRILCDGSHGEGIEEAEEEIVEAIAREYEEAPATAPPLKPPL
ncbi:MAG TPA: hypothetical protein VGF70_12545 [Solirubrobacteraceae bacterium]|jgi:hypothetical protein